MIKATLKDGRTVNIPEDKFTPEVNQALKEQVDGPISYTDANGKNYSVPVDSITPELIDEMRKRAGAVTQEPSIQEPSIQELPSAQVTQLTMGGPTMGEPTTIGEHKGPIESSIADSIEKLVKPAASQAKQFLLGASKVAVDVGHFFGKSLSSSPVPLMGPGPAGVQPMFTEVKAPTERRKEFEESFGTMVEAPLKRAMVESGALKEGETSPAFKAGEIGGEILMASAIPIPGGVIGKPIIRALGEPTGFLARAAAHGVGFGAEGAAFGAGTALLRGKTEEIPEYTMGGAVGGGALGAGASLLRSGGKGVARGVGRLFGKAEGAVEEAAVEGAEALKRDVEIKNELLDLVSIDDQELIGKVARDVTEGTNINPDDVAARIDDAIGGGYKSDELVNEVTAGLKKLQQYKEVASKEVEGVKAKGFLSEDVQNLLDEVPSIRKPSMPDNPAGARFSDEDIYEGLVHADKASLDEIESLASKQPDDRILAGGKEGRDLWSIYKIRLIEVGKNIGLTPDEAKRSAGEVIRSTLLPSISSDNSTRKLYDALSELAVEAEVLKAKGIKLPKTYEALLSDIRTKPQMPRKPFGAKLAEVKSTEYPPVVKNVDINNPSDEQRVIAKNYIKFWKNRKNDFGIRLEQPIYSMIAKDTSEGESAATLLIRKYVGTAEEEVPGLSTPRAMRVWWEKRLEEIRSFARRETYKDAIAKFKKVTKEDWDSIVSGADNFDVTPAGKEAPGDFIKSNIRTKIGEDEFELLIKDTEQAKTWYAGIDNKEALATYKALAYKYTQEMPDKKPLFGKLITNEMINKERTTRSGLTNEEIVDQIARSMTPQEVVVSAIDDIEALRVYKAMAAQVELELADQYGHARRVGQGPSDEVFIKPKYSKGNDLWRKQEEALLKDSSPKRTDEYSKAYKIEHIQDRLGEVVFVKKNVNEPGVWIPAEAKAALNKVNEFTSWGTKIRPIAKASGEAVRGFHRYWKATMLAHPGTVLTNTIGGGLQFTAKAGNDLFMDFADGLTHLSSVFSKGEKVPFKSKRFARDVKAMFSAFGKGKKVDTRILGGTFAGEDLLFDKAYISTLRDKYGRFGSFKSWPAFRETLDRATVGYMKAALFFQNASEIYWKRVAMLSEMDIDQIEEATRIIQASKGEIGAQDRELIRQFGDALSIVDRFTLNYNKNPEGVNWLRKHIMPWISYIYNSARLITSQLPGGIKQLETDEEMIALLRQMERNSIMPENKYYNSTDAVLSFRNSKNIIRQFRKDQGLEPIPVMSDYLGYSMLSEKEVPAFNAWARQRGIEKPEAIKPFMDNFYKKNLKAQIAGLVGIATTMAPFYFLGDEEAPMTPSEVDWRYETVGRAKVPETVEERFLPESRREKDYYVKTNKYFPLMAGLEQLLEAGYYKWEDIQMHNVGGSPRMRRAWKGFTKTAVEEAVSTGPALDFVMFSVGLKNKYDQHKSTPDKIWEIVTGFAPFSRLGKDIKPLVDVGVSQGAAALFDKEAKLKLKKGPFTTGPWKMSGYKEREIPVILQECKLLGLTVSEQDVIDRAIAIREAAAREVAKEYSKRASIIARQAYESDADLEEFFRGELKNIDEWVETIPIDMDDKMKHRIKTRLREEINTLRLRYRKQSVKGEQTNESK